MGSSFVTFSNNQNLLSGTIYSYNNGYVHFKENSSTVIYNNIAEALTIYMSDASFEGNSTSKFYNNFTNFGGVINLEESSILFDQNSNVEFSSNIASTDGGAMYSHDSYIYLTKNSVITFNDNIADNSGGAISLAESSLYFEGNSFIQFFNNTARHCGAIYSWLSNISFIEKSTTEFCNNNAFQFGDYSVLHSGGAVCTVTKSHITFGDDSCTKFNSNVTNYHGGALYAKDYSDIRFFGNSTVTFTNNKAATGAIVYSSDSCKIMVTGNSTVIINDLPVKWCTDACILMYTDQNNDAILIDSNGIVWCSIKEAFTCLSKKCHCKSLEDI